jgi:hypothetical protein
VPNKNPEKFLPVCPSNWVVVKIVDSRMAASFSISARPKQKDRPKAAFIKSWGSGIKRR